MSPEQSVWTTRVDDKGAPDNPLYRLATVLFAKAGVPWRGENYPAARMFRYLQEGTAQFSMLVKAPMLETCCLLSRRPVAVAEIRVYRRSGVAPVGARADLVGKKVITIRGYSYGGLLDFIADEKNRVSNQVAPSHVSAFRMLAQGRADYLLDYTGPAGEVLAAEPVAGVQSDSLSRQDIHLVLSKSYPDAPALMQRLETIAESLDLRAILGPDISPERTAASRTGR